MTRFNVQRWMWEIMEGYASIEGVHIGDIEKSKALERAKDRFQKNAVRVFKAWKKKYPGNVADETSRINTRSHNEIAHETWNVLTEVRGKIPWEGTWRDAILRDDRLYNAFENLRSEMWGAVWTAEAKANPKVTIQRKGYTTKRAKMKARMRDSRSRVRNPVNLRDIMRDAMK